MDDRTKYHLRVAGYLLAVLYVTDTCCSGLMRLARLIEGLERAVNE